MRPLESFGSGGATTAVFAALAGLAALETVGDFGVFFVEGKKKFYQEDRLEFRVSNFEEKHNQPRFTRMTRINPAIDNRFVPIGENSRLTGQRDNRLCL